MECRYCRAQNAEDDHRCQRCGRRLRTSPAYVGSSAAAPELQFEPAARPEPVVPPVATQPLARPRAAAYQQSLFSSREVPRVVPFETISPVPLEPREVKAAPPRHRTRKAIPGQQSLEFSGGVAAARSVSPVAQPVI